MDETLFEGCSVIFRDILECYKPEQDIICVFSVKDETLKLLKETKQENDCFVGIFHVGWDSLFASITRRNYTLIEAISKKTFQVTFKGDELPDANIDEYYQFCFYNVKSEVVYGASCPFQICENKLESFVVCSGTSLPGQKKDANGDKENMGVWMEDNDDDFDTVLVAKKSVEMEESLSKFKVENELLLKETETMKFQSKKSAEELNQLINDNELKDRRAKILEENISDSEKVINHLNNQMKEIGTQMDEQGGKIKELIFEKEDLESSRAKAHLETNLFKSTFKEKEAKLSNEIRTLQNSLENEKKSRRLIEDEYQNVLGKLGELEDAHGKEVQETKQTAAKLIEAISNVKVEKQKNEAFSDENDDLKRSIDILNSEKESMESLFLSKEECLQEEINSLKEQFQNMVEQINELQSRIMEMKQKEAALNELVNEFKSHNAVLEGELEEACQVKTKEIENLTVQVENLAELIEEKNVEIESLQTKIEEKDKEILTFKYQADCRDEETQKLVEELKLKAEQAQAQPQIEEPKPISMSKSEGSYYALQVAYSFIQKQLKQFKTENEELRKLVQSSQSRDDNTLQKEIDDLKLRLKFGKEAFENQFKECQKLKSELKETKTKLPTTESNETFNEIVHYQEKQQMQTEIDELMKELETKEDEVKEMRMKVDEVNDKMKQYDDNMKLLREENKLLKVQVSALLEGETADTIRRKFDPALADVIYQPPSFKKQPEIAYPPSMNKIDRPWLPAAQKKPSIPPHNQVIPNREINPTAPQMNLMSLTLRGCGKSSGDGRNRKEEPILQCPVCQLDFPVGYTEATAAAHVNKHFNK